MRVLVIDELKISGNMSTLINHFLRPKHLIRIIFLQIFPRHGKLLILLRWFLRINFFFRYVIQDLRWRYSHHPRLVWLPIKTILLRINWILETCKLRTLLNIIVILIASRDLGALRIQILLWRPSPLRRLLDNHCSDFSLLRLPIFHPICSIKIYRCVHTGLLEGNLVGLDIGVLELHLLLKPLLLHLHWCHRLILILPWLF